MVQSTADFSADFAALVESRLAETITSGQFSTNLTALLTDQYGTGMLANQILSAQISAFVEQWRLDRSMFRDFLTEPADGGPLGDGMITMTDGAGGTFPSPSLEKLKVDIARGFPAKTDLPMYFQFNFGADELLGVYEAVGSQTFDVSLSKAGCVTAPTASAVITIKKNGAAWGTITYAPASLVGVIVIADPTLVADDLLTFHAPTVADATFAFAHFTLAGT